MNHPVEAVQILSGVLLMGYAVAGLFFLRFWRDTKDRLFGYFAVAFLLLSVQRMLLVAHDSPVLYGIRLVAFVLIIWAIIDKNRRP